MGHRNSIAIKSDKGVRSIYCQWGGFPEENGATLIEHYRTADKINALLDLGDLTELDITPERSVAYHRDRNDSWEQTAPKIYAGVDEWKNACRDDIQFECLFLFDGNRWSIFTRPQICVGEWEQHKGDARMTTFKPAHTRRAMTEWMGMQTGD